MIIAAGKRPQSPLPSRYLVMPIALAMLISLVWVMFTYSYLGIYVRYLADDFCTAYLARDLGVVGAVKHWYNSWSGRFSYMYVLSLLQSWGAWQVPLLPVALLIALSTSFVALLKEVQRLIFGVPNSITAILLSLTIPYGLMATTPAVEQILFWEGGSIIYTLPIILSALFWYIVVRNWNRGTIGALLPRIGAGLLSFAIGGFNEPFSIFHLGLIGVLVALILVMPIPGGSTAIPLLVSSIGSTFLAVFLNYISPGSSIRKTYFPEPNSLDWVLRETLNGANIFLIDYRWQKAALVTVLLFTTVIGTYQCLANRTRTPTVSLTGSLVYIVFSINFLYLVVALSIFPSMYLYSGLPDGRTMNTAALAVILWIVTLGLLSGYWIAEGLMRLSTGLVFGASLLSIPIILLVIFQGPLSFGSHAWDQRDVYRVFAQRWDDRERSIHEQQKNQVTRLELPRLGLTYGLEDISDDPTHWINQCAAIYYRVDEVVGIPSD